MSGKASVFIYREVRSVTWGGRERWELTRKYRCVLCICVFFVTNGLLDWSAEMISITFYRIVRARSFGGGFEVHHETEISKKSATGLGEGGSGGGDKNHVS